jgi:carbon-monoxide dehydrogenase large subunit
MTRSTGYIGTSVRRKEDERFVRGRGTYIADLVPPAALHVAFVRSPVASAVIASLSTTEARRMPGVVAVVTGEELLATTKPMPTLHHHNADFVRAWNLYSAMPPVRCLAAGRVRYVGEAVVAVVAESRYVAEDAAERVDVVYDELEPVIDPLVATAPGAPTIYDDCPGNVALSIDISRGSFPDEHDSLVIVEDTYTIGRHAAVPIECRGVLASFDEERDEVQVWTSTQMPHFVRESICGVTGWGPDKVRVRVPDVGGGFGAKATVYGEESVLAILAHRLGRDIAWVEDRYEHLVSAAQARDQVHRTRLAVTRGGDIAAWQDDFVVDIGVHNFWMEGITANTAHHLLGPYRIPNFSISGKAVMTNKTPTAQYRGSGRPEACFALDRSLDRAAKLLGLPPDELKYRNLLTESDRPHDRGFPWRDGVNVVYDGGDYRAVFQTCLDLLSDSTFSAMRDQEETKGRRVGKAIATYIESTGRGPFEAARVILNESGTFDVFTGAASAGQGQETAFAQIAADSLCVTPDEVAVGLHDTGRVPDGIGSFASRSTVTAGNAVRVAAEAVVDQARNLLAAVQDSDPSDLALDSGGIRNRKTGEFVPWKDVSKLVRGDDDVDETPAIDCLRRFEPPTVTWTMGAHMIAVSVDPDTGHVAVLGYYAVDEGGALINPMIVDGQAKGAIVQGISGALLEEFPFDESGQPLASTLADYLLARSVDVPDIEVVHRTVPTDRNPLGVKGVGECGSILPYALVAGAIDDALSDVGCHIRSTPVRPETVYDIATNRASI